ncbi:MAG: hypothetical protein KA171_23235, partial [Reyranella sp.]|nr:hypothetical protein [Reyranella sp.]
FVIRVTKRAGLIHSAYRSPNLRALGNVSRNAVQAHSSLDHYRGSLALDNGPGAADLARMRAGGILALAACSAHRLISFAYSSSSVRPISTRSNAPAISASASHRDFDVSEADRKHAIDGRIREPDRGAQVWRSSTSIAAPAIPDGRGDSHVIS